MNTATQPAAPPSDDECSGPAPSFGAEHGAAREGALRRLALAAVPERSRRRLLGGIRRCRYRGAAVECPCCANSYSRFLPHRGRARAKCPGCGSLERHRMLWLFLERETALLDGGSLLHVAPEYALMRRLTALPNLRYVSGDLSPSLAELELDVMDLPFSDGSFDFLICNHVLEHVADDRRAIAEIHRVLRPGGWAILMCPVDHRRASTLEDPSATTAAERHARFGQGDHRRLYGRDYADRLATPGFSVRVDRYADRLEPAEAERLGLRREEDSVFGDEPVYFCVKR